MSRRLRAEVEVELSNLLRLVEQARPVGERAMGRPPGPVEVAALGAMLHAFYNGIENVLKRAAVAIDGGVPSGDNWHAALLDAAGGTTAGRSVILSTDLVARLRPYLLFRHLFRHAYTFELQWSKMRPLVESLDATFRQFDQEVRGFLAGLQGSA